MEQPKEYYAFISYKREDEKWADWLDALELAGGVLAKEIETALQQSKFLIVICSPNSA